MDKLIEYPGYLPVAALARDGCTGCAFEGQPLFKVGGGYTDCGSVECFSCYFPPCSPLRDAESVIWIKEEA